MSSSIAAAADLTAADLTGTVVTDAQLATAHRRQHGGTG